MNLYCIMLVNYIIVFVKVQFGTITSAYIKRQSKKKTPDKTCNCMKTIEDFVLYSTQWPLCDFPWGKCLYHFLISGSWPSSAKQLVCFSFMDTVNCTLHHVYPFSLDAEKLVTNFCLISKTLSKLLSIFLCPFGFISLFYPYILFASYFSSLKIHFAQPYCMLTSVICQNLMNNE